MILECENGKPINYPTKQQIEKILKSMRSEGPCSFASLTSKGGDYVQVAGGLYTCLLERRDVQNDKQYRAYHKTPSTPFPDGTILSFSGGDIALKKDEWFSIDDVLEVFQSFSNQEDFPRDIYWREIDFQ